MRAPPISTLFPYTTLFRSWLSGGIHHRNSPGNQQPEEGVACGRADVSSGNRGGVESAPVGWSEWSVRSCIGRAGVHRSDRKSTRLNSSHVEISYAVFCLKK